ncbi:MAG: class I SAM-dependent methyltransferase [Verrucomicrobiota bacterium]
MKEPNDNAEFDHLASSYDEGLNDLAKSLGEEGVDVFVDRKAAWVRQFLQGENSPESSPLKLLDFGCGTGRFLRAMQRSGLRADFEGCDISSKMLEAARQTWDRALPAPPLHHTAGGKLPFASASFDVVTASCVFHHIPPGEWIETAGELFRILKPGGRLLILEHNPWNPLTRWLVSRCPIDENAVLLSASECLAVLQKAGFQALKKSFIFFVPPRFRALWEWEGLLKWLPLGAQYIAVGRVNKSAVPIVTEGHSRGGNR